MKIRDHGTWTCVLSSELSLETEKQVVELLVLVTGDMGLVSLATWSGVSSQLRCVVTNTWPPPVLTWTLDTDQGTLDTSQLPRMMINHDDHLVTVSQMVTFTPHLSHSSDVNISCNVVQTYNDVITTRKKTIKLQMLPNHPATYHVWLSDTVAGVTFIIVTVISIIIIVMLLLLLLVRRYQRRCLPCVTPVYTCTLETVPTPENITTQPRSVNVSYIDLFHDPDPDSKSMRMIRDSHISPPPAYSDTSIHSLHSAPSSLPRAYTLFQCQHQCFSQDNMRSCS